VRAGVACVNQNSKKPGGPRSAGRASHGPSFAARLPFLHCAASASASADFCLSFAIPDARRGFPAPAPRTNPSKNVRPVPAGGHKKTQPRFPAKRRPRLRVRLSFLTGTRLSQPEVPPARPKPARRFGGRPPGKTSFCEGLLPCHRLARRQPRKTFFPAPLPARPAPHFRGAHTLLLPGPRSTQKRPNKNLFLPPAGAPRFGAATTLPPPPPPSTLRKQKVQVRRWIPGRCTRSGEACPSSGPGICPETPVVRRRLNRHRRTISADAAAFARTRVPTWVGSNPTAIHGFACRLVP